ncbi:hypothetical protein FHP29_03230 [Nocardioides albidus]|uniref:Integral membrane protein n=1 Tax=Nocardioides albidus TaxID=1517589 RepID=A0A5C4WFY1_9ACTN|nr:hypothetical protein [Nocardioides albidus]TNM47198.1 hypothetical protein FHP29_03230 [Nocardioides albidus]
MTEGPTEHPSDQPSGSWGSNPPPLTVAASVAGVQGLVLILLSVLEVASVSSDRLGFGLSTAVFFAAYGVVLVGAAFALGRRHGWARGPVLITQLIVLGLAWNLREQVLVALGLAAVAVMVVAAMVHPDTLAALEDRPESE